MYEKENLSEAEFQSWLFNIPRANDNYPDPIEGWDDPHQAQLFRKWGYTGNEEVERRWVSLVNHVCEQMTRKCQQIAEIFAPLLPKSDAIWTACCLGVMRMLFYWIQQLPVDEAVYILEQVSIWTDKTVKIMRKGKAQ